jgi:hypothetical protein
MEVSSQTKSSFAIDATQVVFAVHTYIHTYIHIHIHTYHEETDWEDRSHSEDTTELREVNDFAMVPKTQEIRSSHE